MTMESHEEPSPDRIVDKTKGIDAAIPPTPADGGEIANRRMKNDGDVSYRGDAQGHGRSRLSLP